MSAVRKFDIYEPASVTRLTGVIVEVGCKIVTNIIVSVLVFVSFI